MKFEEKLLLLESILKGYGKVAVAFSGGVDSAFLLLFAKKVLGAGVTAVTVTGPHFAPDEMDYAAELCRREGIGHTVIDFGAEILAGFAHNPPDRCYICKKAIFSRVADQVTGSSAMAGIGSAPGAAEEAGAITIADGTNLDDMRDYRPGRRALEELGVASPLKEAGLTKAEVRRGLKELGGEIWDKPAFACLASRIPYGEEITEEKLSAIYQVESYLKSLGFRQVRVRHHGDLARIEVDPAERAAFFDLDLMDQVCAFARGAGFRYVALDLAGYQMGSLNGPVGRE